MRRASEIACRCLLAAAFALAPATAVAQQPATVLEIEVRGAITPVIAGYVDDALERAEREGHEALLVTLDTPGGLDTAMRDIVRSFLNSSVPVIVWVGPPGARAASAGAVITLAAHVAAMAPGTNIGAATPVGMEGGDLGDKVVNDAAAYVSAIAERTGRDPSLARDMVRDGRSEPASAALRLGAIDLVAANEGALLERVDGRTVELADGDHELRTGDATLIREELGFFNGVRQRLADPNIAFLFLSLGTLAIVYEVASPGMGLGGIAGVILLVLAMFALSVLPVNAVGILLLLLAAGLFIAELFVAGIGVLGAGGSISLALAGLFLVRGDQRVAWAVLVPTAVVMFGAVMLAGRIAWRARHAPSQTGAGQVLGLVTDLRRADGRKGQVFLEGAWWSVRADRHLEVGDRVRVTDVQGLELVVEHETADDEKEAEA